MAAVQTDAQVTEICRQAFEAEHYGRYQEAFAKHAQAVASLNQLADDAKFLDRERKRVARKQAKFHNSRRDVLQPIISGQKKSLDFVLPSVVGARECLSTLVNDKTCIGLDECLLATVLKPIHAKMSASLPQGTAVNVKQVLRAFLASLKDNPALITAEVRHLISQGPDGTYTIPYYTEGLDKKQPSTAFHVYVSTEMVLTTGRWYYFKIKDAAERQTLYVLQCLKRPRYQVAQTQLSRATEFTSPCVRTMVTPIASTGSSLDGSVGRQLTHLTSAPLPVVDKPDRTKHVAWEPRRFTWGGRHFVWKKKAMLETELYEVKREWPQPGSKTGKMLDECFEPLVHAQSKFGIKKASVVTFKYGTGNDFFFRELVLASLLTSQFVMAFGHND